MEDWNKLAESSAEAAGRSVGAGPSWSSRIVAAAAFAWIVFVTFMAQLISWIVPQFASKGAGGGVTDPDFIATLVQAALLLAPLAVLAVTWRQPRYRLIFRVWALAALFNLLASAIHLPDATAGYASVALQIATALLFSALVAFFWRRRQTAPGAEVRSSSALTNGLAVSPLLLLPWVAAGAPGAPLEAALNVLAALLFGLSAALLLRRLAFLDDAAPGPLDLRLRGLGGFVAGAALAPMASSYGFGGVQLLLLITVPATGWMAANLIGRRHATLALTALVGLSAAGPLLFIDPRELALSVSFGLSSTLGIAFRAALIALLLAWILGALLLVWRWLGPGREKERAPQTRGAAWRWLLAALPAWLLLILVFLFAGNPGFHGDRLFVILREQPDVSGAKELNDAVERRRFVYETLVASADGSQAELRSTLEGWGIAYTPYYLVNSLEVEGGPLLRLWLERRPEVERVLYSPILRPAPPEGVQSLDVPEPTTPPWNISLIGADAVWEDFGVRGAGVVVGQSDSGAHWDHPQLAGSYRGADGNHDYDWFDPWYGTQEPTDTGGHGTHTLGTVLGVTTGVAPEATWFGCANLARNVGSAAYYLDCLQFMLAPFPLGGDPLRDGDPALGANVLNNSWGCPELEGCDATVLLPAVRALRHAGTFIVVSAGNDGPACETVNSPLAIYDLVFSVGAIDRFENVTVFSSRGPVTVDGSNRVKPDIVAPGLDILSAYPPDSYRAWQGTSMAGPHIAGVVALMWSANPALIGDIDRTEQILIETARPLADAGPDCGGGGAPNNLFGYGVVDAYAAVQEAVSAVGN